MPRPVEQGCLLKGGGGALTREKIVAANTALQIIIIDESKSVDALGKFPVAVEVLPFGWQATLTKLVRLGCTAHLRGVHSSPFFTDNKNYIVDCEFGRIEEARVLSLIEFIYIIKNGNITKIALRLSIQVDRCVLNSKGTVVIFAPVAPLSEANETTQQQNF